LFDHKLLYLEAARSSQVVVPFQAAPFDFLDDSVHLYSFQELVTFQEALHATQEVEEAAVGPT
jgi:hypothetical protein